MSACSSLVVALCWWLRFTAKTGLGQRSCAVLGEYVVPTTPRHRARARMRTPQAPYPTPPKPSMNQPLARVAQTAPRCAPTSAPCARIGTKLGGVNVGGDGRCATLLGTHRQPHRQQSRAGPIRDFNVNYWLFGISGLPQGLPQG